MPSKRIEWIDNLKAFACFLVLFGHLIQSLMKANIDPIMNITNYLNWFIYLFHMPLFMCISGILYFKQKKNFTFEQYKKFEIKKIINLIVPYLTFYLIYFGLNVLFSSSVNNAKGINDLIGIINNPMPPYWFLYALLSIFIFVPIVDKICKNKYISFSVFVILKIISLFWNCKLYIIKSTMGYGIYFYLGNFINEKKNNNIVNISVFVVYFLLSILVYNNMNIINDVVLSFIGILFAIVGILLFTNIFKNINKVYFLKNFKKYTFEIYLTHTIFAAMIRIVLLKLNIDNYIIHLFAGLIFSIYIPVLMSTISKKIGYTEFFFYPIKTIEKYKKDVK